MISHARLQVDRIVGRDGFKSLSNDRSFRGLNNVSEKNLRSEFNEVTGY